MAEIDLKSPEYMSLFIEEITEIIEPKIISLGLVEVTSGGRVLTKVESDNNIFLVR